MYYFLFEILFSDSNKYFNYNEFEIYKKKQ